MSLLLNLPQLDAIERHLVDLLHRAGGDPVVRAHLQRSLVHIREASIGIREPGCCRSVDQLTRERDGFDRVVVPCLELGGIRPSKPSNLSRS